MRWVLSGFAAALMLAVAANASAATSAGGVAGVQVPTLDWAACGHRFQCATATVPQDYANPAGPTFQLAVIRLPARDLARRIGSLFTNPGGPGETGVDFLRDVAPALAALNERFDLVSWDPRGVGASRPAVRPCFTDAEWKRQIAEPALTPQTLDERSWIAEARAHVMQCLKRNPGVLPYLSTGNVARDLDVLRAAVGDERLTYLGYSYGTAIGMTYVSLFPDRQRAVVLDSPVDTRYFDDPLSFWHDSTAAREVALGRFLERCRRQQARCGFGGAHPRRALDALLARLERTPIAVAGGLPINGDIARGAIGDLLDPRDWMQLADSLSLARHGDGSLLEFGDLDTGLSADATFDEAGFVIKALDGDWPTSIGLYRRDGRRAFRDLPHFYVDSGFVQLPFAFLKLEPNGRFGGPFRTPDDAPTTLVVSATFDPQTPYASAQALTATLGNARLLTLDGDGHGASYVRGNACIDDAVTAYLVDLQLPEPGKVCPQALEAFPDPRTSCARPRRVYTISFRAKRYPHIRWHFLAAVRRGWPRTLVVNRAGANARAHRLLRGYAHISGEALDQYPPAVGRGEGKRLVRGRGPRGWEADVAYVPRSEQRDFDAVLTIKLRRRCDGVKFRYVFS